MRRYGKACVTFEWCMLMLQLVSGVSAFVMIDPSKHYTMLEHKTCRSEQRTALWFSDDEVVDNPTEVPSESARELNAMERTWRSVKKPMVRIGSKGTALSHGNSLRELLNAHTVVKVKVNNSRIPLEETFAVLKEFAVQSGASQEIEMIQARDKEKIILVGLPGTMEKIENGLFPPPPPAETES